MVERVASLPLVSSTYDMVSSAYCTTKDNHPYLKSMCEVAELGVRTITTVALTGAAPIIGKLEPQSKNLAISKSIATWYTFTNVDLHIEFHLFDSLVKSGDLKKRKKICYCEMPELHF